MEDEVEDPLLEHDAVEGGLQVFERLGVGRLVEVLAFPVAGDDAGELPAEAADHVGIGVVLDRVDERWERDVLAEPLLAVGIEHQVARQARVVGREDGEDRRVDREEMAAGARLVEDLGEEPRADGVERVAAGHPEGDRLVAGDLAHQVDAAVVGASRLGEVPLLQAAGRGGSACGTSSDSPSVSQAWSRGSLGSTWLVMMLTGARPSIALSRLRIGRRNVSYLRRVAHVVDGQHHDRLDSRLADPLGRDQLGEVAVRIIRIHLVEVGQAVAVRLGLGGVEPRQNPRAIRHKQAARKRRRRGMATLLHGAAGLRRAIDGTRVRSRPLSGWPVSGLLARGQWRYHRFRLTR